MCKNKKGESVPMNRLPTRQIHHLRTTRLFALIALIVCMIGTISSPAGQVAASTSHMPATRQSTANTPGLADISEVLYDGSLDGGTQTPDEQGFEHLALDLSTGQIIAGLHKAEGGITTLDTTPEIGYYAGYSGKSSFVPNLDPSTGYKLTFTVQVESEDHISDDRAGFSVILLGKEHLGIELGFWTNQIWAQKDDPLFTHGEEVTFDTASSMKTYELTIKDTTYTLTSGGTTLLTGNVRDYSDFSPPPGFPNVYNYANFVFMGDNSSRGQAKANISYVEITSLGRHKLNVEKTGDGTGTVTSTPAGINCGTDCTQDYAEGTSVTLLAAPSADGSAFAGWSGDCTGATAGVAVVVDGPKTCTASFTRDSPGVSISPTDLEITEGARAGNYSVRLSAPPTATVQIALTNDDQVRVAPSTLSFSTLSWSEPQTVTVTIVDDSVVEGKHTGVISHTATSDDPNYNATTITNVTVNITDNDIPVPTLTSNFADGKPGSVFLFTATGFEINAPVTVTINSGFGTFLTTDGEGNARFHLNTTDGEAGSYEVAVGAFYEPLASQLSEIVSAKTTITLDDASSLRSKDTSATDAKEVMFARSVYLPLVER